MADKYHHECGRTLRHAGFYADHPPDAHFAKWQDGKPIIETPLKGRPDFIFVGSGMGGAVDVKTGRGAHRQNWPFDEWTGDQRCWAECWTHDYKNQYWLFITVGTAIRERPTDNVRYPRRTILLPGEDVLRLEAELDRKSLPYDLIARDQVHQLQWLGNNLWEIPATHPFWRYHARGDLYRPRAVGD